MYYIKWLLLWHWICCVYHMDTSLYRGAVQAQESPHTLWTLFTEPKNWNEAELLCEMTGGHLADVNSEARYWTMRLLMTREPWEPNIARDMFVGLHLTDDKTDPWEQWVPDCTDNIMGVSPTTSHRCTVVEAETGALSPADCRLLTAYICERHLRELENCTFNEMPEKKPMAATSHVFKTIQEPDVEKCLQTCDQSVHCWAVAHHVNGACYLYDYAVITPDGLEFDPDMTFFGLDCLEASDEQCKRKCEELGEVCVLASRHVNGTCFLYDVNTTNDDLFQLRNDASSTLFTKHCFETDINDLTFDWMQAATYTGNPLTSCGRTYKNGYVYTMVKGPLNWTMAKAYCHNIGQKLADGDSELGFEYVQHAIWEYYDTTYQVSNRDSHWVNMLGEPTTAFWYNEDNEEDYEPDSSLTWDGESGRHCGSQDMASLQHYYMKNCSLPRPFICMKEKVPCMILAKSNSLLSSNVSGEEFETKVVQVVDWEACKTYCENHNYYAFILENSTSGMKCLAFRNYNSFFPNTRASSPFVIYARIFEWAVLHETTLATTTTTTTITTATTPTATTATTATPSSSSPADGLCSCRCAHLQPNASAAPPVSASVITEIQEKVKRELAVEKTSTYKNRMRLKSAPDERISSTCIGLLFATPIFAVFGLIVLMDLGALVKACLGRWRPASSVDPVSPREAHDESP